MDRANRVRADARWFALAASVMRTVPSTATDAASATGGVVKWWIISSRRRIEQRSAWVIQDHLALAGQ